ncbi:hypothetical protein HanXRQr2_Chr17g0789331 [Helianthus annuus]|uniref:Uncharacterized protein n=1 Tax=Helianthus annuus TaxID=4232 RepID=A0A9K3GSI6_HELAN|nr:hypothetical protein HanXRQr2_Chr17g0789331 [Helianthus annuus]KAJ0432238.1 hypothetical protein HanIR_Chr17g0857031 [Helianthus annuus]
MVRYRYVSRYVGVGIIEQNPNSTPSTSATLVIFNTLVSILKRGLPNYSSCFRNLHFKTKFFPFETFTLIFLFKLKALTNTLSLATLDLMR